ncbi:Na+/H+ antiporter NhaD/arsenite permease-like protein [Constrictibacter sp. MBR-5]|jgi:Na+/H+ antiporter NhaD/arsenite permease-like protein|uniref:sodium:proton antiporter n=1 Tax=Constrictibacter sp. MBR-5 TaxID=3156467 RepID=UPI0033995594
MGRRYDRLIGSLVGTCAAFAASPAAAATAGAPHLDGAEMGLIWVVPFVAILLSIALFPLFAPEFWHHHFGKVAAACAAAFLVPFLVVHGVSLTIYEVVHVSLLEYLPFIILLLALFTVAGGIRLRGSIIGTPAVNTGFLLFGTLLASWTGTTGAAMLLIRPVIRANEWRRYKVHTIVFFIFLVANIGGSLTPLGDPPLFLGFLKGVSFFWPTQHMFLPMVVAATVLLAVYFAIDSTLFRREAPRPSDEASEETFGIDGKINILLLAGIVGAVLLSGIWKPGIAFDIYHVQLELQGLVRDVLLLLITFLSWKLTSRENREANGFSWFPIIEVGKLFAGIFLTIIPAIAILKAGTGGALGSVVSLVTNDAGEPVDTMYFWLTGLLSSFLDNAPTYLVFFNTAGGDPAALMGPFASTLLAISAGAVFMGANTYIGNAPNFMVKAIAEERGIAMPSFFGYMLWSVGILIPIFVLITFLFFH